MHGHGHSTPVLKALSGGAGTYPSFFVETGVRQSCVLAPAMFSLCMDWLMGCRASFGEERFTDLDFADDAAIFAENMQSLVECLTVLSQKSGSLGLRVSWITTKIQNCLQAVD